MAVLILVLVEYTLEDRRPLDMVPSFNGLNPCFSGIYSRRSSSTAARYGAFFVLILVLVEYTLEEWFLKNYQQVFQKVLILVLVEYTLEEEIENLNASNDPQS